jgi:hypothetical protein
MESLSNRNEYSNVLPLTANFVLESAHVTWAEVVWAYKLGLIGWRTLKEFAQAALQSTPEDDELLQLASVRKEDASKAEGLARQLASRGPELDETTAQKKWLYLLLKRLYENRSSVADPFGLVEHVYADFEYPQELEGFVRWMPATEAVSTLEEGAARMDRKWRTYLEECASKFGTQMSHP